MMDSTKLLADTRCPRLAIVPKEEPPAPHARDRYGTPVLAVIVNLEANKEAEVKLKLSHVKQSN